MLAKGFAREKRAEAFTPSGVSRISLFARGKTWIGVGGGGGQEETKTQFPTGTALQIKAPVPIPIVTMELETRVMKVQLCCPRAVRSNPTTSSK